MQEIAKRLADSNQITLSGRFRSRMQPGEPIRFEAAKEASAECGAEISQRGGDKIQSGLLFLSGGRHQNAKNYLKKAFEIDLNLRVAALEDEDLKPLWESL